MRALSVYLETGSKRTFAGAIDWPGWERAGRDEAAALDALVADGPRYRAALGDLAADLSLPAAADDLDVVERREGDASTDFGIPAHGPTTDEEPVDDGDLARLSGIVRAAWAAFDASARAAVAGGAELRKGPRGGGRDVPTMIDHVLGAEGAYLRELGGRPPATNSGDVFERMAEVRRAALDRLADRARGVPVEMGRRTRPFWTPRYFVRRSAWHALDHAWEIEDRSAPD